MLGNHDQPRIAARVGAPQARVAAMLLMTLRGTPTLYYGDEIGLAEAEIPPEQVQDPWEKNEPGLGLGRDPERTPMQWDASSNAGFTAEEPWLPLAPNYEAQNVEALKPDPASILTLYRRLITFRRRHPALSVGSYHPAETHGDVFAYERRHRDERLLIGLNLGHEPRAVPLPDAATQGRLLLSTVGDRDEEAVERQLQLQPDEA